MANKKRKSTKRESKKRKSPYSNLIVLITVIVIGVLLLVAAIVLRSLRESRRPGALGTGSTVAAAAEQSLAIPGDAPAPGSAADPTVASDQALASDPTVIELVDRSRPLVRDGVTIDDSRVLPTTVWHPEAAGAFPLVVFAHGYEVGPLTYARFCAALAALGFVVAAPSFALADASRGLGLDRSDIPNEADDIDFVISQLRATDPRISATPVAVIGHSDGATAALLMAERPNSMSDAVGAVIAIAPDSVTGELTPTPPPVLIIHGTDDPIAPFADGEGDFERFSGTRFLLALEGADHLAPIVGDTPWTPVLDHAVALFLAGTIDHTGAPDPAMLTAELDQLELSHASLAD